MADFFSMPPWPPRLPAASPPPPPPPPPTIADRLYSRTESSEAKARPPNSYTSKVRVQDRYKVVGFISSGTYGRVYKAVGINGQIGEFAIKKCVSFSNRNFRCTWKIITAGA